MPASSTAFLSFLLAGGSACAFLFSLALPVLWPEWHWHQEPLHSTMEALGGLASIAMAIVLFQRRDDAYHWKFQTLAVGFLGMGILELLHAVAEPGNSFVLLRNMASLVGGVGFSMTWLSADRQGRTLGAAWFPWMLTAGVFAFGLWALSFPDQVPEMIRNGEFTPMAVAPQSLACACFFAATARLFLDYWRSRRPEDYLFASLSLMFGVAELVFMSSVLWDGRWWFWHMLRLTAYLLVLLEVSRSYLQTIVKLRASLEQTTRAEDALRQSLEDRERIAQDLHDGVIQSIFAVTLGLERCQRLLSDRARDVIAPLAAAVADLKLVIRDLRGYLIGLEPPISNGRELEVALASLVRSMTSPAHSQYVLEIDPLAADHVNPEQASHLLSIVREALSNSLRHSDARGATVRLRLQDGSVRLIVEDDGVGFDVDTVSAQGHGLKNMGARARKLGGRFDVISEPGRGTRILCDLPQEPLHARI